MKGNREFPPWVAIALIVLIASVLLLGRSGPKSLHNKEPSVRGSESNAAMPAAPAPIQVQGWIRGPSSDGSIRSLRGAQVGLLPATVAEERLRMLTQACAHVKTIAEQL